jgi:hypothetical protein
MNITGSIKRNRKFHNLDSAPRFNGIVYSLLPKLKDHPILESENAPAMLTLMGACSDILSEKHTHAKTQSLLLHLLDWIAAVKTNYFYHLYAVEKLEQ